MTLATLYRRIFYHKRAKYLCGWLGVHTKPVGWEWRMSYTCPACGNAVTNMQHPLNWG